MAIHTELERVLAEFKQVDAVVVFQSGFTANAGTVSSILSKEDVVISDELNHASIIDGCRLSRATIKVFRHKDVDAARAILRDLPAGQRKLLITDGVFSMDGDLGPLPALCELAEATGCIMMVDDACERRVRGEGRGTVILREHGRVDVRSAPGEGGRALGVRAGSAPVDFCTTAPSFCFERASAAVAGRLLAARAADRRAPDHRGCGQHAPFSRTA